MTKKILTAAVILISSFSTLFGQFSGEWETLKDVKKSRTPLKIDIRNNSDIEWLKKKPSYLFETYSLKLDNIQGSQELSDFLNQWQNIEELYIKNSLTNFDENDFKKMQFIEHVILEVNPNDSNTLIDINFIPNLKRLTLVFSEAPKNWDFLYYYKKLNAIHVYGSFMPEDIYEFTDKLKFLNNITELGISIDFATDLARNLNLCPSIRILKLYDNLSRLNSRNFGQYQPQMFNINGAWGNDQPAVISVLFYSDDFGFTAKETRYIESIWAGIKAPYEPPEDRVDDNDILKDMYNVPLKPVFQPITPVHTLLEDLYPSSEVFEISGNRNQILHTKSGVNLFIPAGAINNGEGEKHNGKAYVSIRSTNNLLDIAFRGLNLSVTKYPNSPLYTANTYVEVEISDGDFPLTLNQDYNIRLDLPSIDAESSFYYLDPDSKSFMDYEMYKNVFQENSSTQIPIRYDEWIRENSAENIYNLDNRSFNDRFKNPETYFLFDYDNKVEKYIKANGFYTTKEFSWASKKEDVSKNSYKLKEGRGLLKIRKPKVKYKKSGELFFKLEERRELFTELKVFKRALLKFADTLSNKEFNAEYSRNKAYSDFRLETNKIAGKWNLILKSDEGYKIIPVDANFYKKNGKPYSKKGSDRKLKKYKNWQGKRDESFNSFTSGRLKEYSEYYITRQNTAVRKDMFKTVFIKNTGVFSLMSIDKSEKGKNEINCFLNYLDANGLPIDVKQLFMIEKSKNTVHEINSGNTKIDMDAVSLILCTDYKGQLHYITGEMLRNNKLSNGSIYFLRMNTLPHQPRSIDDFKTYIKYDRIK